MKHIKHIFFGSIVGLLCMTSLSLNAQNSGKFAAPVFRVSPYARQISMGEAFTALASDINVMRYNISGLGNLQHTFFSAHYHDWIADTKQFAFEGGLPTPFGVFGANLAYFDEGDLVGIDENFQTTGETFSNYDLMLAIGYGNQLQFFRNTLLWGLSPKLIRQNLVDESATGIGLDVGLLYLFNKFSFGATVQNYTLKELRFTSGISSFRLPETIKLGLGYREPLGPNVTWSSGLDVSRFFDSSENDLRFAIGSELRISEVFAVRGGYKFSSDEVSRWGSGFGFIVPMAWFGRSSTTIDYAFSPLDAFDSQAHRFSLSFHFGTTDPFKSSGVGISSADMDRAKNELYRLNKRIEEANQRLSDLDERLKQALAIADSSRGKIEVSVEPDSNILVTLRVNFDFDKSEIRPDMYGTMYKVSDILKLYNDSQAWFSGHTDSIGTDEYNIRLSQRRMASVIRFLVAQGLEASSFYNPVPYGEWRPLNNNSTEEERFRNRRVEFLLYTGNNKPERPVGSKIDQVLVQDDTIFVIGNGRLTYTRRFVDTPPRAVIVLPKVYISDSKTIPVNKGNIRQIRIAFHPEESSTWVVLDLEDTILPEVITLDNRLIIRPGIFKQRSELE